MGLFDKLFGGGKKKVSKETAETRGVHMPDLNIPVDEKFTIHFMWFEIIVLNLTNFLLQ